MTAEENQLQTDLDNLTIAEDHLRIAITALTRNTTDAYDAMSKVISGAQLIAKSKQSVVEKLIAVRDMAKMNSGEGI